MLRNGTLNNAQTDSLHAHPYRHALTAKEVVFGDGGGVLDTFFDGVVVYVVFRPHAEGIGVIHLTIEDFCAARAGVGDDVVARVRPSVQTRIV